MGENAGKTCISQDLYLDYNSKLRQTIQFNR